MTAANTPLIQRSPHDAKNPYTMVSRALIRDDQISPNCRLVLIHLLSNVNGWNINFQQLRNQFKNHFGENKLRQIFKEAINAGYLEVEEFFEKGLRRIRYLLSETPKSLRMYPRDENPDVANPDVADHHVKEEAFSKKEHKKEKKPPIVPQKGTDTKLFSKEAEEIAGELLDRILKVHPKAKPPDLEKWAHELDVMHKADKREWDDIRRVIKWAFEESTFWYKQLHSPKKLRKHYDAIIMQMSTLNNKGEQIERNKRIAFQAKTALKATNEDNRLIIHQRTVTIISDHDQDSVSMELPSETFEDILRNRLGLRGSADV